MARLAAFSVLVSSGTVLAATGLGQVGVTGAALFYLISSTLGLGAFFLLIELVERGRAPGADVLAVTAEAFGSFEAEESAEVGQAIPATWALLGLSFVACTLLIGGLPPLPGFVAKVALLDALLAPREVAPATWIMMALLLFTGLATVVAASRTGVRIFWAARPEDTPRVQAIELAPILLLLGVCMALAVEAGPVMRYLDDAAQALHAPRAYIEEVLR
jgi:multicomponent K+:H+ antiporter subunit D